MLVFNGFLIALSPLFLEFRLQRTLCMLDDGGVHFDTLRWDDWFASQSIVARAKLMDFVEEQDVSNFDIT